ncbi:hypothetical protein OWV82_020079 [Melia azedarach]|uniref:Uncharacterized protein n=1 Tax=Melia azedarach TaxID=155640 RepID=A0ACC1X703_MELAZ|nr:hypothetical protein OWV82_020079 [Melia azedarach]
MDTIHVAGYYSSDVGWICLSRAFYGHFRYEWSMTRRDVTGGGKSGRIILNHRNEFSVRCLYSFLFLSTIG